MVCFTEYFEIMQFQSGFVSGETYLHIYNLNNRINEF
uniref:Uncharacterized protein n=1 Tax=Anguilla anguilla TaxID=7936 RepID=A0A0E9SFY8_ANGAN